MPGNTAACYIYYRYFFETSPRRSYRAPIRHGTAFAALSFIFTGKGWREVGWWRRSKEKANNRALFIRCACKTRSFFSPFCRLFSFYPSPAFLPSPSLLCFILYSLSVYIRNVAFDRPFVVGSLPFRREIDLHPRIIGRNYWELLDVN